MYIENFLSELMQNLNLKLKNGTIDSFSVEKIENGKRITVYDHYIPHSGDLKNPLFSKFIIDVKKN